MRFLVATFVVIVIIIGFLSTGASAKGRYCSKKVRRPVPRIINGQNTIRYETRTIMACCEGYAKLGAICIPLCEKLCENSKCTAPNQCTCEEGYWKSTDFRCEPKCDGCKYGFCSAPGHCECYEGYEWSKMTDECLPKCDPLCVNGFCSSPGFCSCHDGYQKFKDISHICDSTTTEQEYAKTEAMEMTRSVIGTSAKYLKKEQLDMPYVPVTNDVSILRNRFFQRYIDFNDGEYETTIDEESGMTFSGESEVTFSEESEMTFRAEFETTTIDNDISEDDFNDVEYETTMDEESGMTFSEESEVTFSEESNAIFSGEFETTAGDNDITEADTSETNQASNVSIMEDFVYMEFNESGEGSMKSTNIPATIRIDSDNLTGVSYFPQVFYPFIILLFAIVIGMIVLIRIRLKRNENHYYVANEEQAKGVVRYTTKNIETIIEEI